MATAEVINNTTLFHPTTIDTPHTPLAGTFVPHFVASLIPTTPITTEIATTTTTAAAAAAPTTTTSGSSTLSLLALPTEIHLLIFSNLDSIDSTVLGLTCRHFYTTYREAHPARIPLNQRRRGPNTLESAWEVLGPTTRCRFCGIYRCELHMHIREFMPPRYEYCHVRQVFGLRAEGATDEEHCYRCCPPMPKRCGKHWLPKGDEVRAGGAVEVSKL